MSTQSTLAPAGRLASRPLLALAAVKLLVYAALGGRYGFHRDELYYLVGGRHLDLGYVDHPPLVPWLAGLAESLFGLSLYGLRLFPALAGAAIVFLAGVLARRLGGDRQAQLLAALATLLCPFHLMTQNMFQTVPFDQLWWLLLCLLFTNLLVSDDSRWWIAFGAVAGLALLTKYTVLALGLGVVLGVVLTPLRRELARPWIYLGGLLALALFLPNLLWQVEQGFPSLEFIANNNAAERFPPAAFLALQMPFVSLFSLPILAAGFVHLFSRRALRLRPLGWAVAVVWAVFLLAQSKPYYASPLYPVLFAAGAVYLGLLATTSRRRRWAHRLVYGNLVLLPVFLPVLPVTAYARVHPDFPHPEFGEMFGWPELVERVGTAYRALPEPVRGEVTLLTSNYGSAAALDLWGGDYGLPPASTGQNSYHYWSRPRSIDPVIIVGHRRETLEQWFDEVEEIGRIENRAGVRNVEAERPFYLARGARIGVNELWERVRLFR